MVGAWDDVQRLVGDTEVQDPPVMMARVLLAMNHGDEPSIEAALRAARTVLGGPITASDVNGYRRSYDSVLNIHLLRELEMIHTTVATLPNSQSGRQQAMARLSKSLNSRLDATLPTFRSREAILSMRRTALTLMLVHALVSLLLSLMSCRAPHQMSKTEIGKSWLASAKIARKSGQWQTAYSAMLQARQCNTPNAFMESARLVKASGEPLRALQELEGAMKLYGFLDEPVVNNIVVDLTDDEEMNMTKAKVRSPLQTRLSSH